MGRMGPPAVRPLGMGPRAEGLRRDAKGQCLECLGWEEVITTILRDKEARQRVVRHDVGHIEHQCPVSSPSRKVALYAFPFGLRGR